MSTEYILAEANALSVASSYLQGEGGLGAVIYHTQVALRHHEGRTLPDLTIRYAMCRIVGENPKSPTVKIPTRPFYQHALCRAIQAWLTWCATRGTDEGPEDLSQLNREMSERKPKKGNLRLLTLTLWVQAVEALLQNRPEESKLLFRRSIELGSQYGTSEPVTQWIYVASFVR